MFQADGFDPRGRFSDRADSYARGRPDYPAAAVDAALDGVPPASVIADVGSGTGILTRRLAERGFRVTGVEPNDAMRSLAVGTACGAGPPPEYRAGSAEETGIESGTVAVVVAAQAFHWFDPDLSLREFHRVLRPGGRVALLWNQADESDAFTGAFWELVRRTTPEPAVVRVPHSVAGEALLSHPCFENGQRRSFAHAQAHDRQGLVDRARSISYTPRGGQPLADLLTRLESLWRTHRSGGQVLLRYTTFVYTASRRET